MTFGAAGLTTCSHWPTCSRPAQNEVHNLDGLPESFGQLTSLEKYPRALRASSGGVLVLVRFCSARRRAVTRSTQRRSNGAKLLYGKDQRQCTHSVPAEDISRV